MTSLIVHKVIIAGPVGAGKTTAINALSDAPPLSTEELPSDETRAIKETTTVAMDYGSVVVDNKYKVHIYGIPGQQRFDFMWDILAKGGTGLVILLDGTRPEIFKDLKYYSNVFSDLVKDHQLVIGLTKMDKGAPHGLDVYRQYLDEISMRAPLFEVDARSGSDMTCLIRALIASTEA
ncbi:MAG: ATP/GTP-binding protein [Gammaproteobacteria bacterium]|nr:ATP/GTP-binding protein [Gammaproteobacteria bacterium]